ncbi:tetratricopeptide repeat protein [Metallibacterium scheffleri]
MIRHMQNRVSQSAFASWLADSRSTRIVAILLVTTLSGCATNADRGTQYLSQGDCARAYPLLLAASRSTGATTGKGFIHVDNSVKAKTGLGVLYLQGCPSINLQPDPAQAFVLLDAAAKRHDVQAEYDLGVMYSRGIGVERNTNTAVAYWRRSAQAGNRHALNALYNLNKEPPVVWDFFESSMGH